jgi:hypothetical protein
LTNRWYEGESLGFLQLVGAVLILGGAAFGELFRRNQLHNLPVVIGNIELSG